MKITICDVCHKQFEELEPGYFLSLTSRSFGVPKKYYGLHVSHICIKCTQKIKESIERTLNEIPRANEKSEQSNVDAYKQGVDDGYSAGTAPKGISEGSRSL